LNSFKVRINSLKIAHVTDLKQTNFIERLVEDTLAAETAPDGQALHFQAN
jgi:hypothetical protein